MLEREEPRLKFKFENSAESAFPVESAATRWQPRLQTDREHPDPKKKKKNPYQTNLKMEGKVEQ